jgi:hypothetical protein
VWGLVISGSTLTGGSAIKKSVYNMWEGDHGGSTYFQKIGLNAIAAAATGELL